MTFMKKLLCLCMVLALCLSVAGCASAEDKAFDEANALLAAGDYDGAIAAFQNIGRYQEISSKIEEATKLRDEANAGFLFGTWKDILTGTEFVLESGGTGILTTAYQHGSNESANITYTYADGVLKLTSPIILPFTVTEKDGVTHLVDSNGQYDLVPEANYADLAPVTVEITMDNWQEYFELRQADYVYDNDFGEPDYRSVGYAVFLKEEYAARLLEEYGSISVDFEIQFDEGMYIINGDLLSGEYTLEETRPLWDLQKSATATTSVEDYRIIEGISKNSDLHGQVAGFFFNAGGSWTDFNGKLYTTVAVDPQIIRVQGTLTLKR